MTILRRLGHVIFSPPRVIPTQYRRNFFLLYGDVAFWGILNGSTLTFLAVYAARQGATGAQIGIIGAIPALLTLFLALPTGNWLAKRPIHRTVVWTSIASRFFYLLLVPLPLLAKGDLQVWAIALIILVMTIPGTATVIGFQTYFAEIVPDEWRAYVSGIRNAVVSVSSTLAIILTGFVLSAIPFPNGYIIVFLAGFLGAFLSSISILLIRPRVSRPTGSSTQELPAEAQPLPAPAKKQPQWLQMGILSGKFGRVILLLFIFHLAQYLPIPVVPLFQVNYLKFTDQTISLGSAIFNLAVFIGSTQLERISWKLGHQKVVGIGIILLASYPGLMSQVREVGFFLVTSILGGLAWSMVGGAIFNYIYSSVPSPGSPMYFAFYNLALNAAVLIGSLAGPLIAAQIGFVPALLIFAFCRVLSGAAILKWG
jgi:MFS family permease